MSQSSDSACPTRQQLDELEALMQRMLSLPVSEGNEEPLPPLPSAAEARSRPASLPPRLRAIPDPPSWEEPVSAPPAPPPAPAPRPTLSARVPTPPAPVVISERVQVEEYEAPAVEQCEAPTAVAPVEEAPPSDEPVVEPPPRPRVRRQVADRGEAPPESWLMLPLVWCNQAFDRCTLRLGRPGRWLRGARGRAWIGWSGVCLLVLAAAWAALEWLALTW